MKKEIIAIAAVAVISGMALASSGSDVQQDSVSVTLPKVTVASGEQATTTTGTGTTTTADTKTTATTTSTSGSKTTASDDDEKDTETTTVEKQDKTEEDAPVIEPTEKATEAPQTVASAYSFGFGDLMSGAALSSLGAPNYTGVSPACTTSGSDIKVYEYNGLTVQTFDNGGSEAICTITIKSNNYSAGGVTIGSSRNDVISAFGGDGSFYSEGNKELSFSYSGDTVSSIMFYYPA